MSTHTHIHSHNSAFQISTYFKMQIPCISPYSVLLFLLFFLQLTNIPWYTFLGKSFPNSNKIFPCFWISKLLKEIPIFKCLNNLIQLKSIRLEMRQAKKGSCHTHTHTHFLRHFLFWAFSSPFLFVSFRIETILDLIKLLRQLKNSISLF